jgi:hypothetical protein
MSRYVLGLVPASVAASASAAASGGIVDSFYFAIPGKASAYAITGTSLLSAAIDVAQHLDCCSMVVLPIEVMKAKLNATLQSMVKTALGSLADGAVSISATGHCVSKKGASCVAAVQANVQLTSHIFNQGGGVNYAGIVSMAVGTIVAELTHTVVDAIIRQIDREIDHLAALMQHAICGSRCGAAPGASRPATSTTASAGTAITKAAASSALTAMATSKTSAAPPAMAVPANLHITQAAAAAAAKAKAAPKPAVTTSTSWPKYAIGAGAFAGALGVSWFFFRKPKRA